MFLPADIHVMKIATFNVNSVNARLARVLAWLERSRPDVVVLQEIKCTDENFPADAFSGCGYNVLVHGQKAYNGVAILSLYPLEDAVYGLPGGEDDTQARYIEALVCSTQIRPVRIGGLYLPNGNPAPGEKYTYKLAWMERLKNHARNLLELEEDFVLAGDFNVIPQAEDVHDPVLWADNALYRTETRNAFREIVNLGFLDAVRQWKPDGTCYTFWDYQRGAWNRDHGMRIDHILLDPCAADRFSGAGIDRSERDPALHGNRPSDHVPVWVELADTGGRQGCP